MPKKRPINLDSTRIEALAELLSSHGTVHVEGVSARVEDDHVTKIRCDLDLEEAGDPTTDAYIESFSKGVVKSGFIDPKFKKAKTALGKAITYTAALKDDRRVVGLLTVSGPSRKLSIQLVGGTEATARAEKDFQDLVASLKPAK